MDKFLKFLDEPQAGEVLVEYFQEAIHQGLDGLTEDQVKIIQNMMDDIVLYNESR